MSRNRKNRWKRAAAIISAVVLLAGCTGENHPAQQVLEPAKVDFKSDNYESRNKLLAENQISEPFEQALSQFAFQSGSRILSAESGNINYSPLSLYYAMALVGCGAEGETAVQIMNSLGVQDQSELAEQCQKLYQWLYYNQENQKGYYEKHGEGSYNSMVRIGNSLWISKRLKLNKDYRQVAASQFFAPVSAVDFTKPEAGEQIGRWIAEQTNGVLQPSLQLDPGTMMAVLNTLYFYGGWKEPFAESETADDSFTRTDGSTVTGPFMNRTDHTGNFRKGEGYTLSAMYTNNDCSMIILLPDEGRSVDEFLNTPEQLEAALSVSSETWKRGEVIWKVPKFSFGSSLRLNQLLEHMGMENMFVPEMAEFGKISKQPLFVSDVLQETHIGIDENGVEGAAYTMVMMEGSDEVERAEMILNRPFIYGIQDDNTGAWLFLGVCRDPADQS